MRRPALAVLALALAGVAASAGACRRGPLPCRRAGEAGARSRWRPQRGLCDGGAGGGGAARELRPRAPAGRAGAAARRAARADAGARRRGIAGGARAQVAHRARRRLAASPPPCTRSGASGRGPPAPGAPSGRAYDGGDGELAVERLRGPPRPRSPQRARPRRRSTASPSSPPRGPAPWSPTSRRAAAVRRRPPQPAPRCSDRWRCCRSAASPRPPAPRRRRPPPRRCVPPLAPRRLSGGRPTASPASCASAAACAPGAASTNPTREALAAAAGARCLVAGGVEAFELGGSGASRSRASPSALRLIDATSGRIVWIGRP